MRGYFGVLGALFGLIAVVFGAFASHVLRDAISDHALAIFQTGVQYQFYHALTLFGVGLAQKDGLALRVSGWAFSLGVPLFCGSLYLIALLNIRWMGAIAPIGGMAFMAGWLALAIHFWQQRKLSLAQELRI